MSKTDSPRQTQEVKKRESARLRGLPPPKPISSSSPHGFKKKKPANHSASLNGTQDEGDAKKVSPGKNASAKQNIKLTVKPIVKKEKLNLKTFGDLLTRDQADTTETKPTWADKQAFIESEYIKEEEDLSNSSHILHRKPPQIHRVLFGLTTILIPWYSAPYPEEYHTEEGEMCICEHCLLYFTKIDALMRHTRRCVGRLPPGNEIYRQNIKEYNDRMISVFEINGRTATRYCQRLCLLAKMFLDHKTLYYDVDQFLFYVLVEWSLKNNSPNAKIHDYVEEQEGHYNFVGYFSKEKSSPADYNVSCILTLPHHQRKGYGSFLIDFSYLLTRAEGPDRTGSPEKPLSDLGLLAYVAYWRNRISRLLLTHPAELSVNRVSRLTGMTINDVLAVLEMFGFDGTHVNLQETEFREARLWADPVHLQWAPYLSIR